MGIIFIIIIVVIIIGVIISNIVKGAANMNNTSAIDEETKERRRLLTEKFQREAEEKEKIQKEAEEKEIQKYGVCTKSIKWWFDSKTYLLRVYEESKTLFIMDEEYRFSDIIGVDYIDKIHNVGTIATTTINNKNMAGRALVGGLLAGGLGAAVGAVTAQQQTSYSNSEVHDYIVLINTKILSKPLIEVRIANNIVQVNEVIATLKAVIANNQ